MKKDGIYMPDSMKDMIYMVNALACSAYQFAHFYHSSEATDIGGELFDICAKHGLYEERFRNG